MDTKQVVSRIYDDGNWRELIIHAHPDEEIFVTLQIKGKREGLRFRKRDKEGKLIEQRDLPYFRFPHPHVRLLSPDKSKMIAKDFKEVCILFFHDDAPSELKTLFRIPEANAIDSIDWISDNELLIMEWVEVPDNDPNSSIKFNLVRRVYVYDIRSSERRMISDLGLGAYCITLSDDRKFAAIVFNSNPTRRYPNPAIVRIFDIEKFEFVSEFDIPQQGDTFNYMSVKGTWLDKGKTLAIYNSLHPEIFFHYDLETGTLSEKRFDVPTWKDCWVMGMYDRYWVLLKNGGIDSWNSTYYLYDTVTGKYTKFNAGGDMCLFADHYLLGHY